VFVTALVLPFYQMLGAADFPKSQLGDGAVSSNSGLPFSSISGPIHRLTSSTSPDFGISVDPTSITVERGQVGYATVGISAKAGYNDKVSLSASGQPWGVEINFLPENQGTPSFSSEMEVSVGYEVEVGDVYTITIKGSGADGTEHTVQFWLNVPAPGEAEFVVENLTISPEEVKEDETVAISISVTNVGELEGTYAATLRINGVAVENKSITLAAEGSGQVAFTYTAAAPGEYNVSLGGRTGTFTVETEVTPQPENVENEIVVAENLILEENELATLEVENANISKIKIRPTRRVRCTKMTVQQLTTRPTGVPAPSGEAYSYLTIVAENIQEGDVEEATIFFQIERSWVLEREFEENEIILRRYDSSDNTWDALETQKIGENQGLLNYSASSPGLSLFAITGEEVTPGQLPTAPSAPMPPFWVLVVTGLALVAVVIVVIWRYLSTGTKGAEKPGKEPEWGAEPEKKKPPEEKGEKPPEKKEKPSEEEEDIWR